MTYAGNDLLDLAAATRFCAHRLTVDAGIPEPDEKTVGRTRKRLARKVPAFAPGARGRIPFCELIGVARSLWAGKFDDLLEGAALVDGTAHIGSDTSDGTASVSTPTLEQAIALLGEAKRREWTLKARVEALEIENAALRPDAEAYRENCATNAANAAKPRNS